MSSFYIPKYNCVFIHIPKTAGSSIRNDFFNKDYIGAYHRYPLKYRNVFSFCFVRHPYDRLISAYNFFHYKIQVTRYKNLKLSFIEFLAIVIDESIDYQESNIYTNVKGFIRHHTIPQTHEFNQLQYAKFIGRHENLQTDWQKICTIINASYEPLKQNNVSQKHNLYTYCFQKLMPNKYQTYQYKKYINNHSLTIINQFFDQDFKILNYEKIKVLT